jgi:hypothetical protein
METFGDHALDMVKHMFGFCQASGGLYYGVPNDTGPALKAKRAAQDAQGVARTGLTSAEAFFAKYFA